MEENIRRGIEVRMAVGKIFRNQSCSVRNICRGHLRDHIINASALCDEITRPFIVVIWRVAVLSMCSNICPGRGKVGGKEMHPSR